MKRLLIFPIVLAFGVATASAQTDSASCNTFSYGPMAGYDFYFKTPAYGAIVSYELRFGRHWGLTATATLGYLNDQRPVETTIKSFTLLGGGRYHFNAFNFSGALGWGRHSNSYYFPRSRTHLELALEAGWKPGWQNGTGPELFVRTPGGTLNSISAGFRYAIPFGKKK